MLYVGLGYRDIPLRPTMDFDPFALSKVYSLAYVDQAKLK